MKNKLFLSVAVISLAGAGLFGAANTYAQSTDEQGTTLAQRIASKFNLNQSEVEAVFKEHKAEHHIKMQARFEERLTQAVQDGKITEDQKTKILAKFKEKMADKQATHAEFKNMTPEERKAAKESKHQELRTWANENGIDLNVLHGVMGHERGMGKRMMHH